MWGMRRQTGRRLGTQMGGAGRRLRTQKVWGWGAGLGRRLGMQVGGLAREPSSGPSPGFGLETPNLGHFQHFGHKSTIEARDLLLIPSGFSANNDISKDNERFPSDSKSRQSGKMLTNKTGLREESKTFTPPHACNSCVLKSCLLP